MNSMVIRQVLPKDKPRMLEISATIWDGYDYIPNVADYWLSGKGGITLGVEIDEKLLGFARLTTLSEDTCWLEGIRVDEKARGLGLGKALTEAMVSTAKEKGYSHIELSSFVENYESLGIVKKKGFTEKAAYKYYEYLGSKSNESQSTGIGGIGVEIKPISKEVLQTPESFEALYQRVTASEGLKSRRGYFSYDWTFKEFGREDLKALIEVQGLYELCWSLENSWHNQTPRCSLMALSKRFAKGSYETLHWVEHSAFVEASLYIGTERAKAAGETFNCMLPVAESLFAKAVDGLEMLSDEEEDVFVFYYNK